MADPEQQAFATVRIILFKLSKTPAALTAAPLKVGYCGMRFKIASVEFCDGFLDAVWRSVMPTETVYLKCISLGRKQCSCIIREHHSLFPARALGTFWIGQNREYLLLSFAIPPVLSGFGQFQPETSKENLGRDQSVWHSGGRDIFSG